MHIPAPPFTDISVYVYVHVYVYVYVYVYVHVYVYVYVYVCVYVCYGGNGASTPKWKPIGLDFMGTLLDYPLPPNQ